MYNIIIKSHLYTMYVSIIIISLILVNANWYKWIFSRNHKTDIFYVSIMFNEIIF